jgi:hypothetical protein
VVKQTYESCIDFTVAEDPMAVSVATEDEQQQKSIAGRIVY